MEDDQKTKQELRAELTETRRRIAELETLETECRRAKDEAKQYHNQLEQLVAEHAARLETVREQYEQEINERKRAEETLRKLSRAVEQSPNIVVITDTAGKIEYVNPKFTTVTGYPASRVIGKNPRILKSGQTPPEEYQELWRTITAGGEWQGEFYNRRQNGEFYWSSAVISPIKNEADRITHFLAVEEEITGRKELEERLRLSQKMEAVGRLAGGIAHDFNNLLLVITGHCALLMESLLPGDPIRRDIDEIRKAGERAVSLTRQLLAFSRRQILQPKIINLNNVVTDLEKMLRRLISRDIELLTTLEPALGRVKADPGQIEQVIMNLVINARDAMPDGGTLTIETANVEVDENYARRHVDVKAGSYVMLAVNDTGTGMDAETQTRIFEPFFTTKEPGRGTGLGLATVYGIVQQSNGHIVIESKVEHGTSFRVCLPQVRPAEGPDKVAEPLPEPRWGLETVLIVEDEEGVKRVARRFLENRGYTVMEAASGEEALRLCQEYTKSIHLLLTDVVMPGMNGRQLAERLTGLYPEMKVIYMSGYSDETVGRHGVFGPDMILLQKPFTPVALVSKVREALDNQRAE
jgi:PAS domain S-box-containing protein